MTVISAGAAAVYVSIHYPADEDALNTFSGAGAPVLRETEGAYFIDGPGEDTALVFYPGAKVDPEAYFPLMKKIAESVRSEVSYSKLHGSLRSIGLSVGKDTVIDYMQV